MTPRPMLGGVKKPVLRCRPKTRTRLGVIQKGGLGEWRQCTTKAGFCVVHSSRGRVEADLWTP